MRWTRWAASVASGLIFGVLVLWLATPVLAQDSRGSEIVRLPWLSAPDVGRIGSVAEIKLADDLHFLDAAGTRRFLELTGNPPRDNNYTLAPSSLRWFTIFAFDRSGYVKDDERLDSDELLKILRQQNESSIGERRRLKLPVLHLDGWAVPPHYDVDTKRLEWGTRLREETGGITVNYTIRILGRSGVMSAILVSAPDTLQADIGQFKQALRGFDFVSGERYAEFRQGDKMAEYGLAALIVGGAAAAAAKSGALKGLGKLIIFGAIGAIAAVGALLRRLFGRKAEG